MALLPVVEWPEKVLETRAQYVTEFDADFKKLVADMIETMHHARGIGLAANQVGVLKRVCVVKIGPIDLEDGEYKKNAALRNAPYDWEGKLFVLVNPVIKSREGKIKYEEGCLSFPELYEDVERARSIGVEYQDENGVKKTLQAQDLFSICIQHELDHLDGVVFVNRLIGKQSEKAKRQYLKLKEERNNKLGEIISKQSSPVESK